MRALAFAAVTLIASSVLAAPPLLGYQRRIEDEVANPRKDDPRIKAHFTPGQAAAGGLRRPA